MILINGKNGRTWFNREQEFNMNCAAVTITDGFEQKDKIYAANPSSTPSSHSDTYSYTTTVSSNNECTCVCPAPFSLTHHKRGIIPNHHHLHHPQKAKARARATISYSQRPGMLVADTGNGCLTPLSSAEVKFPHPGPDVVDSDGVYPLELPEPGGACGY